MTSMRRNDVASTSFRRHVPNRFLINQCQIITFLILKYDIIENSRIELTGIVLPVQVGGLLGGPKGMLPPPFSNYWGGTGPPPPPGPPLFLRLWTYTVHCMPFFNISVVKYLLLKQLKKFILISHVINSTFCQDTKHVSW